MKNRKIRINLEELIKKYFLIVDLKERGLTIEEIKRVTGISRTTIWRYLKIKKNLSA
jgi:transcriptional regulator with XRE-family HTH domain